VGPSLQRSPPRKKEEVVNTAALSPTRAEPSRPPLSKSVSAGPGQPFEPPFALGRHGRSVSHNILPTSSFTTSGPSSPTEPAKHNPLTKPSRPHLPASFSSISLPADPSDNVQPQPPRRFAPPTRIVRPAPLPLAEEDGAEEEPLDYLYQTPSGATVLRNPQRLLPGGQSDRWAAVGLGKRPVALGQAQRRVITAPGGIAQSLVVPFRTPGDGNRTLSGTGKEPAKDLEESKPQEATSYFDHVPVTSTSSSSSLTSAQPQADSPLMPVMVKSASTSAASSQSSETLAEDPVEELLKVEEDMADLTVLASDEAFGQEAIEMTVPKSMTSLPMGVVEVVTEDEAPPRGVKKDEATEDVALASAIPLPADEEPNLRGSGETALGLQSGQISTESKSEIAPAISSEADQETDTATVPIAEPSPSAVLDASSILPGTESSVPAGTAKPEIQPRAKVELPPGNIRKPPVPTMPRAITAQVDRKPFKPTARPVTGTSAPTKQTAGGADTAKITSSTSSALTKPVTTAVAPMFKANPVASVPPIPSAKPHVPLVANVTKPTASTAAKASAKPEQPKPTLKPTMPPAKAHPQITLPPVRKEKVRLKAPLPSFVPTRGKVKGSNGPLSSSTTSIGEKKAIVAKFRPEAISLPLSPAQKAKLPPEQIPLPRSPITMDSHLIPTSETLPALTKNHAGFVSQLSPTSDSLAEQNSRALPFAKLINISSPLLNGIGLPVDRFDSVSSRYASSKASTAPPMSSDGEEDEDGLSGITFKSTTAQTHGQVRPKFGAAQLVGGADLMEFSAPSRPALAPRSDVSTPAKSAEVLLAKIAGSTTPKSTPITGRAALSERDPNVGERRERMGEGVSI